MHACWGWMDGFHETFFSLPAERRGPMEGQAMERGGTREGVRSFIFLVRRLVPVRRSVPTRTVLPVPCAHTRVCEHTFLPSLTHSLTHSLIHFLSHPRYSLTLSLSLAARQLRIANRMYGFALN
eukprot:GHVU01219673.1.p2 GENE.GHVU01219673.1~~GHVU01219673.1.p2  ORF type:complete len:124 (-),score=0.93 GHVU01219673.1:348-719(-)